MNNLISIGRQTIPAYEYKEHKHANWEISYYYYGTGTNTIDGIAYRFNKGTIICQPPDKMHSERAKNGYKNYFFTLSELDIAATSPILFSDTANGDFFNIVHQLYYEYLLDGHEQIAQALTFVLTEYIKLNYRNESPKTPYVEQLRHSILANLSNPDFSISDEMHKYPLSINYFRDLFSAQLSVSPKQYLQDIRIEQASKLLETSSLTVSDVSKLCGFSDPYYFSRFFKRKTGKAPSEYQKTHQHHSVR